MIFLTWTLSLLQLVVSVTPVLASTNAVHDAPATTGVAVNEISDGQIQNPIPTKSGTSLFKATDVAGQEIFYVGSVGQNALGSTTTDLFGTVKPATTTNSAGSTITGLAESSATQGGITSIVVLSDIPTLSSIPPSFAFTTVNANNHSAVNLGQILTREDGSTSTAVIMSGISTSCLTIVNPQGSIVSETFELFTRSNGTVVTNTLSFATDSSSLALSIAVAGTSFPSASTETSYQVQATGASGASRASSAASTNGIARVNATSTQAANSAYSSSSKSISHRDSRNAELPMPSQTSSPTSVRTLRATVVPANFASVSPSSPSPGSYAAFQPTVIQSTSFTRQPTARTISGSASAQSALSWSHFPSGSAHISELLTLKRTTTSAGKSGMPLQGQASLSASSMTGSNTTTNTAGGGLYLVAQMDAPLAESLTGALLGQQMAPMTTIPPGMSVESIKTKTKCSHAFAMETTTTSGSTVTTIVPKLCHDNAAFLLFARPATIRLLCTKTLSFLGFLLRWICDPKTGVLIAVDDITPPDITPPDITPPDHPSKPDPNNDPRSENNEPTNNQDLSDRASFTNVPSTNIPSTNVPSTHVPSTSIPSTHVSSTSIPSTSIPSTSRPSSKMTSSASSAVASAYYIYARDGEEAEVSDLLETLNSSYEALQPAVSSTPMSGADWVNVNLTDYGVAKMSSNDDVLLVAPYINSIESASLIGSEVSTSVSFSTLSSYLPTTLSTPSTLSASSETLPSSGASKAKIRRYLPSDQIQEKDSFSLKHNGTKSVVLNKRDIGWDTIAQYGGIGTQSCPRDLAVISWGRNVPAVSNYPYIYRQSQGEDTWAILVSTGIEASHVDFKGNWGPASSKSNIDPNPLAVDGLYAPVDHGESTGTCYASKICGQISGVAKQATIIPMRSHRFGPQFLITVLHKILGEIPARRQKSPPQCLPGKTVVLLLFDYDLGDPQYELKDPAEAESLIQNAVKAIMDLGVIVITLAGDEKVDLLNPPTSNKVPQSLASVMPLLRVGSVDKTGKKSRASKTGDVYMVGEDFLCAVPRTLPILTPNKYMNVGFGTAGAAAAFAGLVLYDLSLPRPRYELGDDPTQYQAKAFAFYTTEGQGSYTRNGGNALVGWNGLDNSDPDQCAAVYRKRRKRDVSDGGACEMQVSASIPATRVTASSLEVATGDSATGNLLGAVGVIVGAIEAGESAANVAGATGAAVLAQNPNSTPNTSTSTTSTKPTTLATVVATTNTPHHYPVTTELVLITTHPPPPVTTELVLITTHPPPPGRPTVYSTVIIEPPTPKNTVPAVRPTLPDIICINGVSNTEEGICLENCVGGTCQAWHNPFLNSQPWWSCSGCPT